MTTDMPTTGHIPDMSLTDLMGLRESATRRLASIDKAIADWKEPHLTDAASRLHSLFCEHTPCEWAAERDTSEPWLEPEHSLWLIRAKNLTQRPSNVAKPEDLPKIIGCIGAAQTFRPVRESEF